MNNIPKYNRLWINEQRDKLLELNPDLIFWVYSVEFENNSEIKFKLRENILTCYENQLENIKWLNESEDITIINLWDLRKEKVEYIAWKKDFNKNNLKLLSGWGIELIETKLNDEYIINELKKLKIEEDLIEEIIEIKNNYTSEKWEEILINLLKVNNIDDEKIEKIKNLLWRKHIITTLRDWGAADKWERTTPAWRIIWNDLKEESEREIIEESPFFWKDNNWNLALATYDTSDESREILKESIELYLERKYLEKPNKNEFLKNEDFLKYKEKYDFVKNNFERNFPWIKYENLKNVLEDIIENNRIFKYNSEPIEAIKWMEKHFKTIILWDKKVKGFVYNDIENNTYEFRKISKITWFEDWFTPLSNRLSRFYFDSENQGSKLTRLENIKEKTIEKIKVTIENINKQTWNIKWKNKWKKIRKTYKTKEIWKIEEKFVPTTQFFADEYKKKQK